MTSRRHRIPAVILAAATLTLAARVAAQPAWRLDPIGMATVAAVRDGRTLMHADGRESHLSAVEVPAGSCAALQKLIAGRALRLEKLGPDHDRYARLVALVFAGDAEQSVQQALLVQRAARVSAHVGDTACADALLAAERMPLAGRRGLWGDPNFAPFAG